MSDPGRRTPLPGNRFRSLFDEAPLAYQSLDANGCLQDVNQAWLHLLGYEREEVLGRPLRDLLPPEFHAQFEHGWTELRDGRPARFKILQMFRRNGTRATVEITTRGREASADDPAVSYCVLRDLTAEAGAQQQSGDLARRLGMILDSIPEAIVWFDANGVVTFTNPAVERLSGWRPADLLGVHVKEHLHGRGPHGEPLSDDACPTCRSLASRSTETGEMWLVRRDGTRFPISCQAQPHFSDGTYDGGVLSFGNITDRLVGEERLRESEAKFRHLFENAPVALWMEDFSQVRLFLERLAASGVTDMDAHFRENPDQLFQCINLIRIDDVNQATLDLHGASSLAELTGNLSRTMTAEAIAVFRQELVALAKGKSGTEAATVVKTLDGDRRHVMFKVFRDLQRTDWDCAYVAFMDLTAMRQMEDMNLRLATALEQTGDSVLITDREGNIVYCNPAFERISGYGREEVLGRNPSFLKSGQHDEIFYRSLWDTIGAGQIWSGRLVNRNKDGQLFSEASTISPIHDADGRIVNFVAVKRDLTGQIELERRLNQSQKMEAVGQLAGGIAHDFNNILHAMLGHLEFAADPTIGRANQQRELALLRESVDRASRLTRQLLAFSRRQVLELKNADPNDLVAQLLKMVRRVIGEDIALDFRPGNLQHVVRIDCGQIEQVLLNLCLNARDAMPDGGRLVLATGIRNVDRDFVSAHAWARPGEYVEITVHDSGAGMPPDILEHIFEPFFTTKERGRGTGLGLATAYGTIKQHGGMILVDSTPGQGSTFTLLLPALPEDKADARKQEADGDDLPRGSETILLAEDDETVRSVIGRVLERAGYRVLPAADGTEALEIFAAHALEIDLALLDLVMPALGGPQVALEIRKVRPSVKILFNTGYSEDAIRGRIPADLDALMMMKPHDPRALLVAVRELLDRRTPKASS